MTLTIWKYELELLTHVDIEMPKGAKLLDVQMQGSQENALGFLGPVDGKPCLWAMVDSEAETEVRKFRILGTGHYYEDEPVDEYEYIGTFQMGNGELVLHLFEIK